MIRKFGNLIMNTSSELSESGLNTDFRINSQIKCNAGVCFICLFNPLVCAQDRLGWFAAEGLAIEA